MLAAAMMSRKTPDTTGPITPVHTRNGEAGSGRLAESAPIPSASSRQRIVTTVACPRENHRPTPRALRPRDSSCRVVLSIAAM